MISSADSFSNSQGIILLGLGPGDPGLITRRAWQILESSPEVYLRTLQHPIVDFLPESIHLHSFDSLYESVETFEALYQQIVEQVLGLGRRPGGVVYAVPGHPLIAETTGPEIVRRARLEGLPVQVIDGLSFLEPVFTALRLDPFPHTALIDGLELAVTHVPPFPPGVPALIAQVYSTAIASDVKLTLMAHYPDEHPVVLVHAAGTTEELVENLALHEIDQSNHLGLLSVLYLPPLSSATSFEAFQELIAHLRAPDGCPWDRKQTHATLRQYLLEETYETLNALDAQDPEAMREEFGDLLLQIVLHAQIAAEEGEFNMAEILEYIHTKIVRRHPHVFGDVEVKDAEGVLQNWERLKAQEREANGKSEMSLLDGVPVTLPALSQASELLKRVSRVGFDWPDINGAIQKVEEELQEVYQADDDDERAKEVGDVLLAFCDLARWYGVDPESSLREANLRFRGRFTYLEAAARSRGCAISDLSIDEMLELWKEAKRQ